MVLSNIQVTLTTKYGGKRAYTRHLAGLSNHGVGLTRRFTKVNWARVSRLLMVCKGNICRSAYAEYRARSLGVSAISAGLQVTAPARSPIEASDAAMRRGIDLSGHLAKSIDSVAIQEGDLVLTMEFNQAEEIRKKAGRGAQVSLLGLWATPVRPYIHDPFGTTDAYFDTCFSIIDSALIEIASNIEAISR